jgi:hypothetical protein
VLFFPWGFSLDASQAVDHGRDNAAFRGYLKGSGGGGNLPAWPTSPELHAPESRNERTGEAGVATVSAVLTVGSSGGGRATTISPWTKQRLPPAQFQLITCNCPWGVVREKSPRTGKHCPWLPWKFRLEVSTMRKGHNPKHGECGYPLTPA